MARDERASDAGSSPIVAPLFKELRSILRGTPASLFNEIQQVRSWLTSDRDKRPSGYMNHAKHFAGYAAFHFPLHLPELPWILEQTNDRLDYKAPRSILDLGCGPGTLTAGYLAWSLARGWAVPETIGLMDLSGRALDAARPLISSFGPEAAAAIKTRKARLDDVRSLKPSDSAEWIFMGHLLNEFGGGPRGRSRKFDLVQRILERHLEPDGWLFILEPPLREPTLDLMWLRDELFEHYGESLVGAPCPAGVERCPLAQKHLGWCYAQPPRAWAEKQGLTPWDAQLRRVAGIRLEANGFSYMVIRSPHTDKKTSSEAAIAVTDSTAPFRQVCRGPKGLKPRGTIPHRGAYIDIAQD